MDQSNYDRELTGRGKSRRPKEPTLPIVPYRRIQFSYALTITAVLTPPLSEGRKLINSKLIEWAQSTLEVQFGYAPKTTGMATLSDIYTALIMPPQVSFGADMQIVLTARGIGDFSGETSQGNHTFTGLARRTVIRLLCIGFGEQPRNRLPDFSLVDKDPDSYAGQMLNTVEEIHQGSHTDFATIWRVLRTCRCYSVSDGKTLKVIPQDNMFTSVPKYTLRLFDFPGGQLGPGSGSGLTQDSTGSLGAQGVFPIINMTCPQNHMFASSGLRGLTIAGTDSKTRAVSAQAPVTDATVMAARTGQGAAMPVASSSNPDIKFTDREPVPVYLQ